MEFVSSTSIYHCKDVIKNFNIKLFLTQVTIGPIKRSATAAAGNMCLADLAKYSCEQPQVIMQFCNITIIQDKN